jgi:cyclohexanone monooxygenase
VYTKTPPLQPSKDTAEGAAMAKHIQLADFKKMEEIRARIDAIVKDPKTAEDLRPWYNRMCERPCFHNDYLPCFNLSNVTLINTAGKGVGRISETGIVAND